MRAIYRICGVAEWAEAHRTGTFAGSDIDRRDGFIHFSTRDQVSETAARYFSGLDNLVLVMVDAEVLGHRLKWEPARGGALFPHLYGQFDTAAANWVKDLPAGEARAPYFAKLPMDSISGQRRIAVLSCVVGWLRECSPALDYFCKFRHSPALFVRPPTAFRRPN